MCTRQKFESAEQIRTSSEIDKMCAELWPRHIPRANREYAAAATTPSRSAFPAFVPRRLNHVAVAYQRCFDGPTAEEGPGDGNSEIFIQKTVILFAKWFK